MVKQTEIEHLKSVERMLASEQPFGDHVYIDSQSWLHYESRLKMLAEHVREGEQTLRAFRQASRASRYRVMGDPVVRSSINTALSYFKLRGPEVDVAETKGVLEVATKQLRDNSRVGPLAMGAGGAKRLGRALHHGWIWKDERDEDIAAKSFRKLFFRQENGRSALWTPDRQTQEVLVKATRLLGDLLPILSRSALNHVHLIAILHVADRKQWTDERISLPFDSFSTGIIPGTIFLSKGALKDIWRTSEYLLHEALHQKHHDLEHTHSMLREGYAAEYSPRIRAVWNRTQGDNSNEWPVCRAVAAFHVYVHLSLFFKMLALSTEIIESYGLQNLNAELYARRSMDRAHHLGQKLQEVNGEVGLAGQRFNEWLLEALASMDPKPSFADLNVHRLDLYEAETEQVGKLIANWGNSRSKLIHQAITGARNASAPRRVILDLVQGDLAFADQIPLVIEGIDPCRTFPRGLSHTEFLEQRSDIELAAWDQAARDYTYRALRMAHPGVFKNASKDYPHKTLGQLLQETVDYSGHCLNTFEYTPDQIRST